MREFKHVVSGEIMKAEEGQPVLAVLLASPSWDEINVPDKEKGAKKK